MFAVRFTDCEKNTYISKESEYLATTKGRDIRLFDSFEDAKQVAYKMPSWREVVELKWVVVWHVDGFKDDYLDKNKCLTDKQKKAAKFHRRPPARRFRKDAWPNVSEGILRLRRIVRKVS